VLHKLEGSEKEFAAQLSQLLLAAQQQKELILESIENPKSELLKIIDFTSRCSTTTEACA